MTRPTDSSTDTSGDSSTDTSGAPAAPPALAAASSQTSTATSGVEPEAVAARRPAPILVARRLAFAAVIVALDLVTKSAVFAWLEPMRRQGELVPDPCFSGHVRWPLAGEWFSLMLSLNPGAAFGQLQSVPYLLVGGRVVAVLFLVTLILRTGPGRRVFSTALVLVLGGALGNLYDNLLRARDLDLDREYQDLPFGPVRDFIDVYFSFWQWHFPTFNVADSCITVGAVLLLLSGFGAPSARRSREATLPG